MRWAGSTRYEYLDRRRGVAGPGSQPTAQPVPNHPPSQPTSSLHTTHPLRLQQGASHICSHHTLSAARHLPAVSSRVARPQPQLPHPRPRPAITSPAEPTPANRQHTMSQFFDSLWNSIFTPGPTPTLLVATNASFAALQLVLFALLLATYSIHFVVLSILCGGLWWAINWFAKELRQAQEKEEAAKKIRERRDRDRERSKEAEDVAAEREPAVGREGGEGEGMDTGDDTETETETESASGGSKAGQAPPAASLSKQAAGPTASSTTGAQTSLAPMVDDALKKRRSIGEGAESSTDSEWEKIEQER